MTLAFEDANSELLNVVSTAGVDDEECVDDSLVKIFKLNSGQDFEAEILRLNLGRDSRVEFEDF